MVRIRVLLALALPLLPLVAVGSGCGGGSENQVPARVSGMVTYNGTALKAGTVTFHSDRGAYRTEIDKDGSYSISDVPVGELTVTVETEYLKPKKGEDRGGLASKYTQMPTYQDPEKGGAPAQHYTKIPAIYANAKNSPLRATLSRGSQTKNLELKD